MTFGEEYELEIYSEGNWYQYPFVEQMAFNSSASGVGSGYTGMWSTGNLKNTR
jgi:hypothetical protein